VRPSYLFDSAITPHLQATEARNHFSDISQSTHHISAHVLEHKLGQLYSSFIMVLLIAVMTLLSPLRLVLSQNLTELLTVGATTADLAEFDLSEVANMAGDLHRKYFLVDQFATPKLALDDNEMISVSGIHHHLLSFNNLAVRLDLANCNFPRHIIDLCHKPSMTVQSFSAILHAEILRTGRCADTMVQIQQADKLAEEFREKLHGLPTHQNLGLQMIVPYTERILAQERLDQPLELIRRYQDFLIDLSRLSKATLAWLGLHPLVREDWSHHLFDRKARLQRLETLYTEAYRNASIAARLGNGALQDHWTAVESYGMTVCHSVRGLLPKQGEEAGNFAISSWPAMFLEIIW
jgi:hypothetical protein